jgi:hypothetical protein
MKSILECSMTVATLLVLSGLGAALEAQNALQPQLAEQLTATKGAQRLTTLTQTSAAITSSSAFVSLGSTTIMIPSGQTGRLLATFSGEALCNGTAPGWCTVRILADGVEMSPAANAEFVFASPGHLWESKSMDRISVVLGPGVKTITVQWRIVSPATSFRLDDWQLTVVYWRMT